MDLSTASSSTPEPTPSVARAVAFIQESISAGIGSIVQPVPVPVDVTVDIQVRHVEGARGDLYDGAGNLLARDVEVAPYVVVDMTLPVAPATGSRFAPLSPEWRAETIALAKASEEDIEDRIATGMIPPRPPAFDSDAFSAWFSTHLRCDRPDHRFFVRARGSRYCAACNASLVLS